MEESNEMVTVDEQGGGEMDKGIKEKDEVGEKKKVGRPVNAERLKRERANSLPLVECLKRGEKRKERQEEKKEMMEIEVFRKSTRVERSPVRGEEGGWSDIVKEMRAGFREMRESREEMKRWMEEAKRGWDEEREKLEARLRRIEEELEGYKERERKTERDRGSQEERGINRREERQGGNWKEMEERMRRLEWEGEKKRREEKKRNIIIRGVEMEKEGEQGLKEKVEEIVKETGASAKIEKIRKIGKREGEGGERIWVRFEKVEEKIEVMKGKNRLRDRKEWISDDLTEKERRIEWKIRRVAEDKRREGLRVRTGYMKIWIEGTLWIWDEIKDELMMRQREGGWRKEKDTGKDESQERRGTEGVFE